MYIYLHSLRHACATLLLNNGIDLNVVSKHLGHHDIGITADIYRDVLLSQKKTVANPMSLS
ncbi:tyrosine-type recombinase/integrase [[Clostridium] innocuum]|nr:tyrosine-type recombinase/integrase [[Clostridium] innocuum]